MSYYSIGSIVKSSAPILFLTSFIGLFAGQIMNSHLDSLISYPILLLLIPALIKIGGDTGSMLGARLASAFHMGLGTTRIHKNPVVRNSLIAAFIVGIIASCFLSVVVWIVGMIVYNGIEFTSLFSISVLACVVELVIVYAVTLVVAVASHKFGLDPDDTVIPIIATIGDVVGISAIFGVIALLEFV